VRYLVTGAASGIGQATASLLASQGHEVTGADVNPGDGVRPLDVRDADAWEQVVNDIGPLDGLVNCAGIREIRSFFDVSVDDFRKALDVNLIGPFLGMRTVVRHWREAGRAGSIVNVSSVSGIRASSDMPHYCSSKSALIMMSQASAAELAPIGIRVNVVAPGAIDTPMGAVRYQDPEVRRRREASIPVKRLGEASEIAHAIEFLLSERASYAAGAVLVVDGGLTMRL
jgi:NAD(P)-dependent dehydrogenase (short-subunit alcohol dehydrogenase family)